MSIRLSSALIAVFMLAFASRASAEIVIKVDKYNQRMTVLVDGLEKWKWPVSTGIPGRETPSGKYTAFRMEKEHFSKEWDDAPMPHSIFFTMKGHAIHGSMYTKRLGRPASHGCVRISPENAEKLYNLVEKEGVLKTKVILTGDAGSPSDYVKGVRQQSPFDAFFGAKDDNRQDLESFWDANRRMKREQREQERNARTNF